MEQPTEDTAAIPGSHLLTYDSIEQNRAFISYTSAPQPHTHRQPLCPSSHMHVGRKAPLAQEELVEKPVVACPTGLRRGPRLPPGDEAAVGMVWRLFCARATAHLFSAFALSPLLPARRGRRIFWLTTARYGIGESQTSRSASARGCYVCGTSPHARRNGSQQAVVFPLSFPAITLHRYFLISCN